MHLLVTTITKTATRRNNVLFPPKSVERAVCLWFLLKYMLIFYFLCKCLLDPVLSIRSFLPGPSFGFVVSVYSDRMKYHLFAANATSFLTLTGVILCKLYMQQGTYTHSLSQNTFISQH